MPASMAACRTVLPLATVTCLPSIVRVTVSISWRSYQSQKSKLKNPLSLLKLGDRGGVAIDLNLPYGLGCRNRLLDDGIGKRNHDVAGAPVCVCEGHGHGQVEDEIAKLL